MQAAANPLIQQIEGLFHTVKPKVAEPAPGILIDFSDYPTDVSSSPPGDSQNKLAIGNVDEVRVSGLGRRGVRTPVKEGMTWNEADRRRGMGTDRASG